MLFFLSFLVFFLPLLVGFYTTFHLIFNVVSVVIDATSSLCNHYYLILIWHCFTSCYCIPLVVNLVLFVIMSLSVPVNNMLDMAIFLFNIVVLFLDTTTVIFTGTGSYIIDATICVWCGIHFLSSTFDGILKLVLLLSSLVLEINELVLTPESPPLHWENWVVITTVSGEEWKKGIIPRLSLLVTCTIYKWYVIVIFFWCPLILSNLK